MISWVSLLKRNRYTYKLAGGFNVEFTVKANPLQVEMEADFKRSIFLST
jgi:hypothetical protein